MNYKYYPSAKASLSALDNRFGKCTVPASALEMTAVYHPITVDGAEVGNQAYLVF